MRTPRPGSPTHGHAGPVGARRVAAGGGQQRQAVLRAAGGGEQVGAGATRLPTEACWTSGKSSRPPPASGGEPAEQLVRLGQGGCVGERAGQVVGGVLQLTAQQSGSCLLKGAVGGAACIHEGRQ